MPPAMLQIPHSCGATSIPAGITKMVPSELVHAMLIAPVDLLWNGGIGTYVKASTETQMAVGETPQNVDGPRRRSKSPA